MKYYTEIHHLYPLTNPEPDVRVKLTLHKDVKDIPDVSIVTNKYEVTLPEIHQTLLTPEFVLGLLEGKEEAADDVEQINEYLKTLNGDHLIPFTDSSDFLLIRALDRHGKLFPDGVYYTKGKALNRLPQIRYVGPLSNLKVELVEQAKIFNLSEIPRFVVVVDCREELTQVYNWWNTPEIQDLVDRFGPKGVGAYGYPISHENGRLTIHYVPMTVNPNALSNLVVELMETLVASEEKGLIKNYVSPTFGLF